MRNTNPRSAEQYACMRSNADLNMKRASSLQWLYIAAVAMNGNVFKHVFPHRFFAISEPHNVPRCTVHLPLLQLVVALRQRLQGETKGHETEMGPGRLRRGKRQGRQSHQDHTHTGSFLENGGGIISKEQSAAAPLSRARSDSPRAFALACILKCVCVCVRPCAHKPTRACANVSWCPAQHTY